MKVFFNIPHILFTYLFQSLQLNRYPKDYAKLYHPSKLYQAIPHALKKYLVTNKEKTV